MLQGISNSIGSFPLASIGCVATGLYIERNFCAAAIYKIASISSSVISSDKADEWNQASNEYLMRAKKDGIRDLTAAAGLIAMGLASSGFVEEKTPPKEESSPILKYAGTALGSGTLGFVIGVDRVCNIMKVNPIPFLTDYYLK